MGSLRRAEKGWGNRGVREPCGSGGRTVRATARWADLEGRRLVLVLRVDGGPPGDDTVTGAAHA